MAAYGGVYQNVGNMIDMKASQPANRSHQKVQAIDLTGSSAGPQQPPIEVSLGVVLSAVIAAYTPGTMLTVLTTPHLWQRLSGPRLYEFSSKLEQMAKSSGGGYRAASFHQRSGALRENAGSVVVLDSLQQVFELRELNNIATTVGSVFNTAKEPGVFFTLRAHVE